MGNTVGNWVRLHGAAVLVGVAFCFLWPFYQRSYYRVTLFYQFGERAEACFALLVLTTLAAWLVIALRPERVSAFLRRWHGLVPAAGATSLVATIYLAGLVTPGVQGLLRAFLDGGATLLFAASLLVVSAAAVEALMAVAFGDSLFASVLVLVGGAVVGRVLSPSFAMSVVSTGVVPIAGIAIAAGALVMGRRVGAPVDEKAPGYLPFAQAPHKGMWLIPLVAYGLLALLHAVAFLNDASTEMHTDGGVLRPAPFTPGNYVVFMLFCLLFSGAAINALRTGVTAWKRAVVWVAAMGVAVGVFSGAFLMSLVLRPNGAVDGSSSVVTGGTMCLIVLLAITVLFMTYQNRLNPLCTFGLFFFGVYALEKVLTYVVCPAVLTPVLTSVNAMGPVLNVMFFGMTFVVLLLFLVQLCRNDALLMLFADGASSLAGALGLPEPADRRLQTCEALGRARGLTAREADILYNLSLGHSARHIADALCISERTVQTHARNVYRKLGVHTRQEVIDLVGEAEAQGCRAVQTADRPAESTEG